MFHFLFPLPRFVFLTAPLAYLLMDQTIIAASPLAIVAYAGPHIIHSIVTASRIQGRVRHSFWSEIYEAVLSVYLLPVTLATLLDPRRGRFNVTDKGGTLGRRVFRPARRGAEHGAVPVPDGRAARRHRRSGDECAADARIPGLCAEPGVGNAMPSDRADGPRRRPRAARRSGNVRESMRRFPPPSCCRMAASSKARRATCRSAVQRSMRTGRKGCWTIPW